MDRGQLYVHHLKPYYYKLYTFSHVFRMSVVLLSTDLAYSCLPGDQGGPIFSDLRKDFFRQLFYVQIGIYYNLYLGYKFLSERVKIYL